MRQKIIKSFLAFVVAFAIVNGFCMAYLRCPYWLDRTANATSGVWRPETYVLKGNEGFGIHKVDKNGYVNDDLPLRGGYLLVLGASHTQGKEVKSGERFTDILNTLLCNENGVTDELMVYNMAWDGHFYPKLVAGFNAAITEFPDSSAVVLEIGSTEFNIDELKNSLSSREFSAAQTGSELNKNMSITAMITALVKENIPFLNVVKTQFKNFEISYDGAFGIAASEEAESEDAFNYQTYYDAVKATAELMRNSYDGTIIIMYHPSMELESDGTILWADTETYDAFKQAIVDSNIIFLDLQDDFQEAYDENQTVPYGFNNTSPGSGHMNKYGHQIAAKALYKVLKEVR